jgi:hypothetical protein
VPIATTMHGSGTPGGDGLSPVTRGAQSWTWGVELASTGILSQLGARRAFGLDLDWGCLRASRGRALDVVRRDLSRRLPFRDGSIELVLHPIIEPALTGGTARAVCGVLRPAGRVIVVTPDWNRAWRSFYNDPTHMRPYSRSSLEAVLVASGLRVETLLQHNVGFWLGRTALWRALPRLCFTGDGLFAIARTRT